jgi:hypothetical protein
LTQRRRGHRETHGVFSASSVTVCKRRLPWLCG